MKPSTKMLIHNLAVIFLMAMVFYISHSFWTLAFILAGSSGEGYRKADLPKCNGDYILDTYLFSDKIKKWILSKIIFKNTPNYSGSGLSWTSSSYSYHNGLMPYGDWLKKLWEGI